MNEIRMKLLKQEIKNLARYKEVQSWKKYKCKVRWEACEPVRPLNEFTCLVIYRKFFERNPDKVQYCIVMFYFLTNNAGWKVWNHIIPNDTQANGLKMMSELYSKYYGDLYEIKLDEKPIPKEFTIAEGKEFESRINKDIDGCL